MYDYYVDVGHGPVYIGYMKKIAITVAALVLMVLAVNGIRAINASDARWAAGRVVSLKAELKQAQKWEAAEHVRHDAYSEREAQLEEIRIERLLNNYGA